MSKKKLTINDDCTLQELDYSEKHIYALYQLLKKRPDYHKISSSELPDFKKHKNFVLNHPYRSWFLVSEKNLFVGSIYLTFQNVIGIYLNEEKLDNFEDCLNCIRENFFPLDFIPSVRNSNFLINVSSQNNYYEKLLLNYGAKEIEKTFILHN